MKNIIIIVVAIVVIAVIGAVAFTSLTNQNNGPSTPFETEFMSGSFAGNVQQANASNDTNLTYVASFEDKENNITYNLTTMDNSSALMEVYKFQGVQGPEERKYNGNNWNIYFGQAMPVVDNSTNQSSNESMGIVICECQKEKQGYVVYVIFNDLSKVNFTLNTFGESYVNFIEPMLKSASLKESSNVPSISEQFGMSQDEFNQQLELIHQVNAGNYSGLQ